VVSRPFSTPVNQLHLGFKGWVHDTMCEMNDPNMEPHILVIPMRGGDRMYVAGGGGGGEEAEEEEEQEEQEQEQEDEEEEEEEMGWRLVLCPLAWPHQCLALSTPLPLALPSTCPGGLTSG
jgi:hypothetical protein